LRFVKRSYADADSDIMRIGAGLMALASLAVAGCASAHVTVSAPPSPSPVPYTWSRSAVDAMCSDAQSLIANQNYEAEADAAVGVSGSLGCVKSRSGAASTTVTFSRTTMRQACKGLSYFGFGHDDYGPQEDDIALENAADLRTRLACSQFRTNSVR
jgi:hypothetical protein